ncbi:MAG: type I-E CRISPR-associated protein Cse1/CasA [Methanocorpusculum sp.]|nr:type I-E CRISPR-associated protein Cse1/CasA [Methanocorpusculum sp.]MDY3202705.1 type I-E CRISPR-associated protein Cse1/CasA [Methanocorpusculum sp.]
MLIDQWIPVQRKDGRRDVISPLDLLSDSLENPVKSIATIRPDFDGAVMQFLIGLYQVLLSPEDTDEWRELLDSPPTVESLQKRIDLIKPAFIPDGPDHRFMQDSSIRDTDIWEIQNLLIEINNTHFLKEGTIQHLCPKCAVMALLTLELNSPSGGRGHMTSLRGGGPLTTLVCVPDEQTTLWKTVLLNLISTDLFPSKGDLKVNSSVIEKIFPWLGILPNSEGGDVVVPQDLHPYHVYWNVPRRIYLDYEDTIPGRCDLCGEENETLLSQYWSRPNGIKYDSWTHPLTPYYVKTDKTGNMHLPVRGKEGGVTYANWTGIVMGSVETGRIPASVVMTLPDRLYKDSEFPELKVHVFGYVTDNAKARAWQEGILPTITVPTEFRAAFLNEASQIVSTASEILFYLISRIKDGYSRDARNMKGDFSEVRVSFWHRTESAFYAALDKLTTSIPADASRSDELHPMTDEVKKSWLSEIRIVTISLFKDRVSFPMYGEADPGLSANAELALRGYLSNNSAKICKSLGLPATEKMRKQKVKK